MEQLQDMNFLHLFYFWMVVRHGNISTACEVLHVTQPTISTQIRKLEKSLGHQLFDRSGRELTLSGVGKTVFDYADEMFAVGREMLGALRGMPTERIPKLYVGTPMVMPKLITYRLLRPVFDLPQSIQIIAREAPMDNLVSDLLLHKYDVILSDTALPARENVRSFNHPLGNCGVSLCATSNLADRYRKDFPHCLQDAPFLLPTANTELRRLMDRWFDEQQLSPKVVAEFDDSAVLKEFGHAGVGVFPVPSAVLPEVLQQYQVELLGEINELRLHFYAITLERKLTHPGVVAISQAAKESLLAVENTSGNEQLTSR